MISKKRNTFHLAVCIHTAFDATFCLFQCKETRFVLPRNISIHLYRISIHYVCWTSKCKLPSSSSPSYYYYYFVEICSFGKRHIRLSILATDDDVIVVTSIRRVFVNLIFLLHTYLLKGITFHRCVLPFFLGLFIVIVFMWILLIVSSSYKCMIQWDRLDLV